MERMYVHNVLEKVKGEIICGDANTEIEDISIDTRTLKKGDTYLALKGENVDGIIYCRTAIEKGAKICFIEENIFTKEELKKIETTIVKVPNVEDALVEMAKIKRDLYNIPVIAITGSVGKTSTKDVISAVMAEKFKVQKTQGNQNNRIGVPLTIMGLKDHDAVVIEMGMNHFGEIRELTQIAKPTLCVISNIGTSHIGNLGSRENILKAKLEILEGMQEGKVIINNDNDLLHKWNLEDKKYSKITFGAEEESDYRAENIQMNENGNIFSVKLHSKEYKFSSSKAGMPFVLNALSAIAVGMEYNIPIEKIQKAIKEVELTKNRMDIVKENGMLIIKDYYNSSFESIKPSLEYMSKLVGGKKIAVLGDIKEVGNFSKELHQKVGNEVVKNNMDMLITVGVEAKYIATQCLQEGMNQENIFICDTNLQASEKLKEIAKVGDKILLKASNSMKFGEIHGKFLNKIKIGIVVGGMSSEHDVSLMSGKSILEKIDKEKYDIKVIYIKKNSNTYIYTGKYEELTQIKAADLTQAGSLIDAIKDVDVIFPILHGRFGEDGSIQGLFEMIEKPYVGCGVLASSIGMDKDFTKKIVNTEKIPVAKSITVHCQKDKYACGSEDEEYKDEELWEKAKHLLGEKVFIKPAREGSSFGVTKASNKEQFVKAIHEAERYDNKILIEEEIIGRELECAVLGNNNPIIAMEVGEIKPAEEFYSYDAKYNNPKSETIIPAQIEKETREKIREYARKIFKILDAKGLSRVDFFLKENGEIIFNEINTLPGFTKISMYPKLAEAYGINYTDLIDKLIKLAIDNDKKKTY